MPFCPLPANLTDDLRRSGTAGVLELGSGDGAFTALVRDLGVEPVTLDRAGPAVGVRPTVVGDALSPPFGRRFGVVVAANLLRQVWPRVRAGGPRAWRDLVGPDGRLWILEDQPGDGSAAARNYRALQELLARLHPGTRGALLPREEFVRACRRWAWPGTWTRGEWENAWSARADRVVAMLDEGRPRAGGEVARLRDAIARDGLAYGRAWWACWQPEDADT